MSGSFQRRECNHGGPGLSAEHEGQKDGIPGGGGVGLEEIEFFPPGEEGVVEGEGEEGSRARPRMYFSFATCTYSFRLPLFFSVFSPAHPFGEQLGERR